REFLRNAVLEHFGVPREIMGITENSNRATSDAAQYIYASNVLMPRLGKREEAINTQLLPFFGADLVWHFDDIVPHSQEFDKAKAL
ncbi:Resolvase/invertase-type recombinase catalytic domain-containing protein, partial [Dysosmobacter welbionis]